MRPFAIIPGLLLLATTAFSTAQEPDVRQGESAAAAARPLAALFGGSAEADSFRKTVSTIPDLQVFEGLPDPATEPALFAREIARPDVMRVGNFSFYKDPLPVGEADMAELRTVFNPGNPFAPGGGEDPCGRFHPDYLLVWKSKDATCYAQIGLGCQEIHAAGPSGHLHRYIPPSIYAQLDRVLGKMVVHRPRAAE